MRFPLDVLSSLGGDGTLRLRPQGSISPPPKKSEVNPKRRSRAAHLIARDPKASRTLIDINELSRRLSIAKGTLYNWVYLRRIPYIKAGRCLRFDPDKVFDSLRQCPTINEAGRR